MNDDLKIRILILDRGFVLVCRCPDPMTVGLWLKYYDARAIRVWGTKEGLAELCDGPTQSTRLDAICKEETCSVRSVIRVLEVDQKRWTPHLK
jgi:hypothetical protein